MYLGASTLNTRVRTLTMFLTHGCIFNFTGVHYLGVSLRVLLYARAPEKG